AASAPASRGLVRCELAVRDRLLAREAVAAAGHPAHDAPIDPDRLVAERDGARVVEHEAAQPPSQARRLRRDQRLAPAEIGILVQLDGEAETHLVRGLLGRDVARPDAIALLE